MKEEVINIIPMSGGKDSTVLADLMCKNGYKVDFLVFYNTLHEFKMMYDYIEKLKKYFKDRYNKEIVVTEPKTSFKDWCMGTIKTKTSPYFSHIRGIPMVWAEPCYWRRESKVKPFDFFIKENNIKNYRVHIGFTLDEKKRVMKDDKFEYPLITDFKMTENDCKKYLIDQEMENPLYRYFNRTGCSFCPAQSKKAWYEVYKNFNEDWQYMKGIEKELQELADQGNKIKNKFWFPDFKSTDDYENIFKEWEKQPSLFDFSDEPLKDCFCKI